MPEPILVDEWQAVPQVLGAVKRAVDNEHRAGRFILTGSVRAHLDAHTWPGTGRLVRLNMYPLTVAELMERPTESFVDRVVAGSELKPAEETPDLLGYIDLALRGGFPEAALDLGDRARRLWLDSYLDHVVTHDASLVSEVDPNPGRLARFLKAYALNSAGLATDQTIYEAAGVSRKTAVLYERLLTDLSVIHAVPAWTSNRLKRLVRSPKRYVIDSSLLAAAIEVVDHQAVLRSGDLLGRVIDTFVTGQIRAEQSLVGHRPRLHHLRQSSGDREVDLIIEVGGDSVIAIEIKASSAPASRDAKHLRWLGEQLGGRFVAGVVLHTGPHTYELSDKIQAAPISTLWSG